MANIFEINRPSNKITLGTTDTTINVASHTASLLLSLDASKNLESVSDLTSWVLGTANQITSTQVSGTAVLSIPDPFAVPGKLTAGSFSSPLDVTNTRQHGFEIHYSGNNYNVTAIRARAQLVTTDTSASAQGALLQAANNDNINAGVLQGALIEAIGKATTNAATITMMRGCLVNTEWSAKDTITDLRILHVRTHTRDAATEGYVSDTGYGIYIENEAVGGNGQVLDAGIYFKGTNLSAGNKAYTYGLDFSGATYGTAEIKLSNGETISNLVDGQINANGSLLVTGHIGVTKTPVSNAGITYLETITITDNVERFGIASHITAQKTTEAFNNAVVGCIGRSTLGAGNTQNFTSSSYGMIGTEGALRIVAGATGTISNSISLLARNEIFGATVTNWKGLYVEESNVDAPGILVNAYGIYIDDVSAGTTLNYAIYTNAGLVQFGDNVGIGITPQTKLTVEGIVTLPKASGSGIKVDTTTPTFGFADLLGDQFAKNTGGTKPTLITYNGAIDSWQFSDGDEAFLSYHIPHDYVPGTDIHLHIHWSQNNAGATGGTIDFKYFAIYAKGHNQASGSTFTSTPITDTFSSIDINDGNSGLNQYQQHITEVIISAASATAALFDRDDFEPDGVIELTFEMDANNLTGTPSDPFIHYVDIHYQTTGLIGTKAKAPDFYT